jgi:hypothetical protein
MKQNKQQNSGKGQQNKSGQCRRSSAGFSRGAGICRNQYSERFKAESVIPSERASEESSLQLLEEQAERLTRALEEIQAKISTIEQQ